jgi:hypothetical protein
MWNANFGLPWPGGGVLNWLGKGDTVLLRLVSGLIVAEIPGERTGGDRTIMGTGDFMERVLNESGEPAGQDSTSAFKSSGAIGKGVRNVLGRGGAVIDCFHVCHF